MQGRGTQATAEREHASGGQFLLRGRTWLLEVTPESGWGWLRLPDHTPLFRFPVAARTVLADGREEETPSAVQWRSEEERRVTLTARGTVWAEHHLSFEAHENFLLVRFCGKAATPLRVRETLLFSRDKRGLELRSMFEGFAPVPLHGRDSEEALFSMVPCSSTVQSYLTPPPALVGIHMPAGWAGIGLASLPDAEGMLLTDSWEVLIDRPFGHIETGAGEYYSPPPVVFVLAEDPWALVERFRAALVELGQAGGTPIEERSLPGWWKAPFYCTYGDQIIEMQPHWCTDRDWAHPAYTSDWVREKVAALERRLDWDGFTVIIDAFWTDPWNADPVPSERFEDLPELVRWLHARGHKVLLWYFPFHTALTDGRGRLAKEFQVLEPGLPEDAAEGAIDATAPGFRAYAAEISRRLFGRNGLDADGLKLDFLFRLRSPGNARYHCPEQGMGLREARLWLEIFAEEARKVKSDVHINWSAGDPHFDGLFSTNRTHDVHRDPLEIQRRARICTAGCPGTPVQMDGCLMRASWAEEAYLAATVYGIPSLYYSHTFHGGDPIPDETMGILSTLLQLAAEKPWGRARFLGYGKWQMESAGKIVAESVEGRALVMFPSDVEGRIFSLDSRRRRLPLHGRTLVGIEPRPAALMIRDGHVEADWVRGVLYRLTLKEGV
jgi:hypothetical protein